MDLDLLVGEMGVFCQNVCGQVVVLVLAVEEQQVAKRLGRERVLLQKELKFLEALRRFLLHVHQGLKYNSSSCAGLENNFW